MSPKFSFFCPSSTPAIIKKKIVRLALGLLSWQHSQAWCHSVRCSARRTQNHSALWHSSCALWMWDHLEWEEMFTQRQSLSIYCKCLLWTSCLFFFPQESFFLQPSPTSWFILTRFHPQRPVSLSQIGRIFSYSTWRKSGKQLDLASRKQKPKFTLLNDIFNFHGRIPWKNSS